jgi:hypothetical protein
METLPTIQSSSVERFSCIFQGYQEAFGQYIIEAASESGKVSGKAKTVARAVTLSDFSDHLNGKTGIGIVPLLLEDKCWFGAIDLDIRGSVQLREDHASLERKIRDKNLPLVVCKSKSNGAHLYLFGSEPIPAKLMQTRLNEFANMLGYGGCEVFPKQVKRLRPTDYGNWINLPYFGSGRCATTDGKEIGLDEFLDKAEQARISSKELRNFSIPEGKFFLDGPPCLQQLSLMGFSEGGRNNALLNIAIYFMKKDPDGWQEEVTKFNNEQFTPPLGDPEVHQLSRSITKKEYNYTCKQAPLVDHCNRKKCLRREFGINSGEDEPEVSLPITSITRYIAGDSYRWGVNTEEAMLEFTTEELLSMEAHRKKFTELLGMVMPDIKYPKFLKQMEQLVKIAETVYDPEEASETGQLIAATESWFLDEKSAQKADEIVRGKWWRSPDNGKIYFIGDHLEHYLRNERKVKNIQSHKLWRIIKKNYRAETDRLLIKGKRRRVWVIEDFEQENDAALPVPSVDMPEEAM